MEPRNGFQHWTSNFVFDDTNTKGVTQSQFLGATMPPGTHLGLFELATIQYIDVVTSYYDATSSLGDY